MPTYNSIDQVILAVANHYRSTGGYEQIPRDHQDCQGVCKMIGNLPPGIGYYRTSLTPDPVRDRGRGNENLHPAGHGLYYVRESEGIGSARVVAHILSSRGRGAGDQFIAWVAP